MAAGLSGGGGALSRFGRQISGGLQEYVEAVTFLHYLRTGAILSLDGVNAQLMADDDNAVCVCVCVGAPFCPSLASCLSVSPD